MRMVSSRSYFARMNENRGDNIWLTEDRLFEGASSQNDYSNIEYNKHLIKEGGLIHLQLWQLK
jgi:hypothetical protein